MFGSMFKTFEYLVKPNQTINGIQSTHEQTYLFVQKFLIPTTQLTFQDVDLTPAFGNTSSSDFSSEEENIPKNKLLRDPMKCNNVLEDIISYEKEAARIDKESRYIDNLNKQGYVVGNNGEVFPVPKFKEVKNKI
jgi:hypothetical protein